MSNERKLKITSGDKIVGDIIEKDGNYTFKYDDSWISSKESFDMSPNIKRTLKIHTGVQVKNFLENLLPEDTIRKRIAEQNKTDDKDIVGLLEITGRDAAGALQVYSEEDFQKLTYKSSDVHTITIAELATGIKKRGSAINFITSVGLKPSLSGAQDKIACRYDEEEGTISFPTNGGATTHILKPNSIAKDAKDAKDKHHKLLELSALNELVSMRLAKKILNNVPDTNFYESTERDLFIVERYDRIVDGADIKRIHQFDFCQYFGISSSDKYEVSNMECGRFLSSYAARV
jgi:serine/threonine-protein kinase HipA